MKKLKKFLAAVIAAAMATTGFTGVVNANAAWYDLEAEDGVNTSGLTHTVGGNTYVYVENIEDQSVTVSVDAEDGTYDIWALIGLDDFSSQYPRYGHYEFFLNDETEAFAKRNNTKNDVEWVDGGHYATRMFVSYQPAYMQWVKVGNAIALDGETSIRVDFERDVHICCSVDKIRLVPTNWNHIPTDITTEPTPSAPDIGDDTEEEVESAWLDFETEAGTLRCNAVIENSAASGGKYMISNRQNANNASTIRFSRQSAGTYDIWAAIGVVNKNYLCEYEFSLDGNKFYDKNMATANSEAVGNSFYTTVSVVDSGHPTEMKWVKVGSEIEIDAGNHTLLAEVGREHASTTNPDGANAFGAIDKIRLVPSDWNHTPADLTTEPEEQLPPASVAVTGVELAKSTLAMEVGQTHTLAYEVTPDDATDDSVSWSSSDASIAYVSDAGVVTAMSAGVATITVTTDDGGFTDTCVVTVTAPAGEEAVDGLVWLEAENAIISGTGYTISNDSNASGGKVFQTKKTNNDPITLTMPFEITEAGEYNIKVLSSQAWPLHLTNYKVKIDGGEASKIPTQTNPSVYAHYLVVDLPALWHNVATMELAEGTHMITIILDDYRGLATDMMLAFIDAVGIAPSAWEWDVTTITKPQAPVAVEEVEIVEEAIELIGGETYELEYDVYPANAVASDLIWTSSNSTVASVDNGIVTGISGGSATITLKSATNEEIFDTCEVTVLAAKANATFIKIAEVVDTKQPGVSKNNGIVQVSTPQEGGTAYEFVVPFNAPEAGTYDVYFTGGPASVAHASKAKYKVDDGGIGDVSSATYYASKGYANKADSTLEVNWQRLERLELGTEEHTITFVFDGPRSMDSNYMFALEYLVLIPVGTELSLTSDSAAENLAEVLMTSVFIDETTTTKDLILHKNALDGTTITWTSSNPDVIDGNGKVTRPSYYEEDAVVTMTATIPVTKLGETYNATKEFVITVPKIGEYTVEDFAVEYASGAVFGEGGSGTLTASVYVGKNVTDARAASLVLVRYDAQGAMADVSVASADLTTGLQKLSTSITIAAENAGEVVEAFLWTDMGAKKLIDEQILTFKK